MSNKDQKYRFTIAYDGTHYKGWQVQPNGVTVQEKLEEALATVLRRPTRIAGSGRTDTGVHARGQVAHFEFDEGLCLRTTLRSLNGLLPPDIRVKNIATAAPDFHSRYSAIGKVYHYHLHLDPVMDPFHRLYATHVHGQVNRELIHLAAQMFVGTHDFTSFANSPSEGSVAKDPVRTLYRADMVNTEGGVVLEFEGNGFLYKMVRNIVGCILDVAQGKRQLEEIPHIFAAKDRRKSSSSAPPQGLFLMEVKYPI